MGKVIFWIVVVFVVLFGLRLWNVAKSRSRPGPPRNKPGTQAMVRCASCGVFLPQADASAAGDGYHCADPTCVKRRAETR